MEMKMSKIYILFTLCNICAIAPSLSRPMSQAAAGDDALVAAVGSDVDDDDEVGGEGPTDMETEDCHVTLADDIRQCLEDFEVQLIQYQQFNHTGEEEEKLRMIVRLCQSYGQSLQCLHVLLIPCPPTSFELQVIAHRIGHLRPQMAQMCYVPESRMTPRPSTRPTSLPSTTPSTTSSTVQQGVTTRHVQSHYPDRDSTPTPLQESLPSTLHVTAPIQATNRKPAEHSGQNSSIQLQKSSFELDANKTNMHHHGDGDIEGDSGNQGHHVSVYASDSDTSTVPSSGKDKKNDEADDNIVSDEEQTKINFGGVLCQTTDGQMDTTCVQKLYQGYSAATITCTYNLTSVTLLVLCCSLFQFVLKNCLV